MSLNSPESDGCPVYSAGRMGCYGGVMGLWRAVVQNVFVVVPDAGPESSRRARARHRKTFCTAVFGMSKMLFENLKDVVFKGALFTRSGCPK